MQCPPPGDLPNPEIEPRSPTLQADLYSLSHLLVHFWGFSGGTSGKEPDHQSRRCKRCGFSAWVRQVPWKRTRQPTPVFLPRESPWTEELGRLQSIGLQRVGQDRSDLAHSTQSVFIVRKQKEYIKSVYCHPACLISMQSTS